MKKEISESDIKLKHLNTNMWVSWVREKISSSLYWTLAFFLENSPEKLNLHSNIKKIVLPVINNGWDILSFTEVYWTEQLSIVSDLLESRWYKVFTTDAFEMWSQNIEKEHLYNVVGIKSSSLTEKDVYRTQLRNKRKAEWIIISLFNMLKSLKPDNKWYKDKIYNSIQLYNRLSSWIWDWAITSFQITDDFVLSHLHIHADNPSLNEYFKKHIFEHKKQLMLWDFNMWDMNWFLNKWVFKGKWYKSFLSEDTVTYSYAKGIAKLPWLLKTPDNVIANDWVKNIKTTTFTSQSDHDWLTSIIKF